MPLTPQQLTSLSRPQLEALYARFTLKQLEREKSRRDANPDPWEQYREEPYRFITEGLGQCTGSSWRNWRTVLRAAYGHPLDDEELAFFRSVAERDPPTRRVRELWLIIGRRGGKDSMASLIAMHAARYADTSMLRPGERALVACFATDKDQAGIVHGYIRGYFEEDPKLLEWLEKDGLSESYRAPIRLKRRVDVQVVTNNFRAPRGRPIAAAVFDECGFWRSEDSASPDVETYNAVLPGMATIPGAILIGISSPHMQKGLLYDKWRNHYGKETPEVLVIVAETRLMNPKIDEISPGLIDQALEDDPERAAAEYLAHWRRDLAPFVPREVIEDLVVRGRHELPPSRAIEYRAFFDASGGTSDSMTLAIAHREPSGRGVLDCLREQRPPFDPSTTIAELAGTLRAYGVTTVMGDRYAGIWPSAEFSKHGVLYEASEESKSGIYLAFMPLLMSARVDLLDNRRMVEQLVGLERRAVRNARDTVDHATGAHDDLANVAAGSLVMVTGDETRELWSAEDLR